MMANEPTSNKTEVSLEDIVREDTAAPAEPSASAVAPGALDIGPIDQLLAAEDPKFAAEMSELEKQVAADSSNVVIDILDLEEKPLTRKARLKVWIKSRKERVGLLVQNFKHRFADFRVHAGAKSKEYALLALKKLGEGFKAFVAWLKGLAADFKHLPLKSKLLVFATLLMGGISVTVLKIVLKGQYLPTLEMHYLRSFEDVANASFTYDEDEPMEDFTDPFFHPEHVMLIDKIVVNLRRPDDGSNPMGLFEFYIEASNDEAAIEMKDREVEVRDLLSRTLERMSYDELVTVNGKNKAKLVLRKAMNQFMTKGRVRRIYFRNVVLKS